MWRWIYDEGGNQYSKRAGDRDPLTEQLFRFCGDAGFVPVQLAFAGVFDRFPDLRIYWAETQIGCLPFALWQIDDHHERYGHMMKALWGLEFPKRRLSVYLRENCLWGFLYDPVGVNTRQAVGVDRVMWGSDLAHAASAWPHSLESIEKGFAGVPEEERYLMLAGNAVKVFHLNESLGLGKHSGAARQDARPVEYLLDTKYFGFAVRLFHRASHLFPDSVIQGSTENFKYLCLDLSRRAASLSFYQRAILLT